LEEAREKGEREREREREKKKREPAASTSPSGRVSQPRLFTGREGAASGGEEARVVRGEWWSVGVA